jgi:hypothetical protein
VSGAQEVAVPDSGQRTAAAAAMLLLVPDYSLRAMWWLALSMCRREQLLFDVSKRKP